MDSVYQLMRIISQLCEIISLSFITRNHLILAEELVSKAIELLPVSVMYDCFSADDANSDSYLQQEVSRILEKTFNFPKFHFLLMHAIEHIKRKSAVKHYSTTLGESGHPGFKLDFEATNGRDAEAQVTTSSISESPLIQLRCE